MIFSDSTTSKPTHKNKKYPIAHQETGSFMRNTFVLRKPGIPNFDLRLNFRRGAKFQVFRIFGNNMWHTKSTNKWKCIQQTYDRPLVGGYNINFVLLRGNAYLNTKKQYSTSMISTNQSRHDCVSSLTKQVRYL